MKRRGRVLAALAIAVANLAPLWIVVKQAFTPERESFAWPPTWVPREWTIDNFVSVGAAVPLEEGLALSVSVALLTVASTMAIALPAAWLAARREVAGRRLDGIVVVARLFPTIAIAVPLAVIFVRLGLYNDPGGLGLWLAHTLLGLPFAFLVLRAAFRGVPVELEEAARLDGASPWSTFVRVSLPLVRPSLGAAAMLVFLVSWDEFAYALLLQVTNRTLPPLLFYLSAFGYPGLSSAVAVLMVVPAVVLLLALEPALRSGVLTGSGR